MKFAIITHSPHKCHNKDIFAYEPYVREMNLWLKKVDECKIVAPIKDESISAIDSKYQHDRIEIKKLPFLNFLDLKNKIFSLVKIPIVLFKIFQVCFWADHIHLRCPGNMGLLGCFVQIFFPNKTKTAKYAGNWDPNSSQPFSYRLQKKILSNTFLTKNCKVLVYGQWEKQTKNILPFFTATYKNEEVEVIQKTEIATKIQLIYVGAFTSSKNPFLSIQVTELLREKGYDVELNMFGTGAVFKEVENYILQHKLQESVILHGNQDKETIKRAFQNAHFLIFVSKSEGWPKVVAEAMFWNCFVFSSKVSCIPYMLDNGKRGEIIDDNPSLIYEKVLFYLNNQDSYKSMLESARKWSQKYTIEYFESEILKLI